jgi:hypothetical protein
MERALDLSISRKGEELTTIHNVLDKCFILGKIGFDYKRTPVNI